MDYRIMTWEEASDDIYAATLARPTQIFGVDEATWKSLLANKAVSSTACERAMRNGDKTVWFKGFRVSLRYIVPGKGESAKRRAIVISADGNTVTAHDKETGKKAVAKCSPEDNFDFRIGAMLAVNRLLSK